MFFLLLISYNFEIKIEQNISIMYCFIHTLLLLYCIGFYAFQSIFFATIYRYNSSYFIYDLVRQTSIMYSIINM